jgi:hypothetical protein
MTTAPGGEVDFSEEEKKDEQWCLGDHWEALQSSPPPRGASSYCSLGAELSLSLWAQAPGRLANTLPLYGLFAPKDLKSKLIKQKSHLALRSWEVNSTIIYALQPPHRTLSSQGSWQQAPRLTFAPILPVSQAANRQSQGRWGGELPESWPQGRI